MKSPDTPKKTLHTLAEQEDAHAAHPKWLVALAKWLAIYVALRWHLLLIHRPLPGGCTCANPLCTKPGKHPREAWKKKGVRDGKTLVARALALGKSNVAAATGAASGIVVIDVDGIVGEASLADLQGRLSALPSTVEQRSGNGRHLFFAHPGGAAIANSAGKLGVGVDVRGDGGCIILAPSRHASGRHYRWVHSPKDTPLASLPAPWLDALAAGQMKEHLPTTPPVIRVPTGVAEGQRNDVAFRYACALRGNGVAQDAATAALAEFARSCTPPLGADEVRSVLESAWKYPPGDASLASARATLKHAEERLLGGDPRAVFDDDTIAAAALVRQLKPALFAAFRQLLSKKRVSLRDFDGLLAQRPRAAGDDGADAELREEKGGYVEYRRAPSGAMTRVRDVSNFVLVPVERRIDVEAGDVLVVDAVTRSGTTRRVSLPNESLIGPRDLLRALGTSEFSWKGQDESVMLLRERLVASKVPVVRSTSIMGRHGDCIVLPTGTFDVEGAVAVPELVYSGSSNRPNTNGDNDNDTTSGDREPTFIGRWPKASTNELLKGRIGLLSRMNVAATMVMLVGWFGALPFVREIRQHLGGFPHLMAIGTMGAGKSTTLTVLARLCGYSAEHAKRKLPATRFARLKALSGSNLVPVIYDEFRPEAWKEVDRREVGHDLRSLYSSEVEERGAKDMSIRRYRLQAPLIVAGESFPSDAALWERTLVVSPNPDTLTRFPQTVVAYSKLTALKLERFVLPYWTASLANQRWKRDLKGAQEFVAAAATADTVLPERVAKNLAVAVFGLRNLEGYLGREFRWVDGDVESAIHAQIEALLPTKRRQTQLDLLVHLISKHVNRSLKFEDGHFTTSGDLFIMNLGSLLPALRQTVSISHDSFDFLEERSYVNQARELAAQKGSYVVGTSKQARFAGGRNLRGVALSMTKMKAVLDIDVDTWPPVIAGGLGRAK